MSVVKDAFPPSLQCLLDPVHAYSIQRLEDIPYSGFPGVRLLCSGERPWVGPTDRTLVDRRRRVCS